MSDQRQTIPAADVFAEDMADPVFRAEWERTALARAVANAMVKYRGEHHLSQRALAEKLAMPPAQVGRLELGEHNPSVDTLTRIAIALGTTIGVMVVPPGQEPVWDPTSAGTGETADVPGRGGSRLLVALGR